MRKICLLDTHTINQIAAGEVIEHPASVIKELVENALDAEATEIWIDTRGGGLGLIQVGDNGVGMTGDDLLLSITRHATSKIQTAADLQEIETLGFRGEALSSIAAVSKMTLLSTPLTGQGSELLVEGGIIKKVGPVSRKPGTTLIVRSLFFNTPARKKAQRGASWHTQEIRRLLGHFILTYPEHLFSWTNDDHSHFSFSQKGSLRSRAQALPEIIDRDFIAHSIPIEYTHKSLSLYGMISHPSYHRGSCSLQYLCINKRPVVSPFISKQILEAYATRLPPRRSPCFILQLTLPPSWVDVNAHPQKKEVRLQEEQELSHFLFAALERALAPPRQASSLYFPNPHTGILHSSDAVDSYTIPPSTTYASPPLSTQSTLAHTHKPRQILAHIGPYFCLLEEKGIRIVHSHRALERVLYDGLVHKKSTSQLLLAPLQLNFPSTEAEYLHANLSSLHQMNIGIRHFGGTTFVVDAIPSLVEQQEIQPLLEAYISSGKIPLDIGRCIQREKISREMGEVLLAKLFLTTDPEYTPNGKRIHRLLDETDFHRLLLSA